MVSNVPSLNHFIILCSSHSKVRFNIFMISAFIIYLPLHLISKLNFFISLRITLKFIKLLCGVIYENFVHLYQIYL